MKEVKITKGKKTYARVSYDSWHIEYIDVDGLNAKEAADKIKAAKDRHDGIRDRRDLLHEINGAKVGAWTVIGETLIPHGIDVELSVVLGRDDERYQHRKFYESPGAVPQNAYILTQIAQVLDAKAKAKPSSAKDFEDEVKQKLGLG